MVKDSYNVERVPGHKQKVPWWSSARLALAVIGFFGFVNVYALRINLSVGMVCMVNHTAIKIQALNAAGAGGATYYNSSVNASSTGNFSVAAPEDVELCPAADSGGGPSIEGQFEWSKGIQGLILGSFFWGYTVSQVPGGWVADRIGGKRVFGWSMLLVALSTLLTPVAARTSYIFLIVLRVIAGLGSGVVFPAMHNLWGKWAPPLERSKLAGFTYCGTQIGNVIALPLSGLLCQYGFDGGWPSIFYIFGGLGVLWCVAWMLLVSDTPLQHKRISAVERDYIVESLKGQVDETGEKDTKVPWLKILSSGPVWGIIVANVTADWGSYVFLTNIPTYMSEVLKFDIKSNGAFSAIPYIAFWFCISVSGIIADALRTRDLLSTTNTRKLMEFSGKMIPALLILGLGFIDCTQPYIAIVLLTLGIGFSGFQYAGFLVNPVDIAPKFAGIIFGISNCIGSITGFLVPLLIGFITKDATREQWQIVFYICSAVYVFGTVFYCLLGSGDLQPWATEDTPEEVGGGDAESQKLAALPPAANGAAKDDAEEEPSEKEKLQKNKQDETMI